MEIFIEHHGTAKEDCIKSKIIHDGHHRLQRFRIRNDLQEYFDLHIST